jgi:hypothetical protein
LFHNILLTFPYSPGSYAADAINSCCGSPAGIYAMVATIQKHIRQIAEMANAAMSLPFKKNYQP